MEKLEPLIEAFSTPIKIELAGCSTDSIFILLRWFSRIFWNAGIASGGQETDDDDDDSKFD